MSAITDVDRAAGTLGVIRNRTLLVAGIALLLGIGVDVSVSLAGGIDLPTALGWPVALVGCAAGITVSISQSPIIELTRSPLAGLAPDRARAIRSSVRAADPTGAALALSTEERRRAVDLARAIPASLTLRLATILLIYAGIVGLQLTLRSIDTFSDWFRPVLGLAIGLVVVASVVVTIVRIRRARAFAARVDAELTPPE